MNKYFVGNKEYTWVELIDLASDLDQDFNSLDIKTTSEAAKILRENGLTVKTYKED
jgi:hypothetical protein